MMAVTGSHFPHLMAINSTFPFQWDPTQYMHPTNIITQYNVMINLIKIIYKYDNNNDITIYFLRSIIIIIN